MVHATRSVSKAAAPKSPIRLVIQQPALPKYRIPVFRELARRPGLQVSVYHGASDASLPVAEAKGFVAHHVKERIIRIRGRKLMWHSPQWCCASKRRADVLLMTWSLPFLSTIPGLLRARANGVPTILWGHGYSKREANWRLKLRLRVGRLATAVLFYNHSTAQRFIEMGLDPRRVFVALNALDQEPIQQARAHWLSRADALTEFQKHNDLLQKDVVLFVSRLERGNRVDLLLQAANELRQRRPALRVIVIGKGDDEQRLTELSRSLELESHVRFAGSIYDEEELAPWFLSARVFCYPVNIGLSILHAFGYGLPVVTSDAVEKQNPEIEAFEHERNGLCYRDGDVNSLADALERLLANPQMAAAMGREGHQLATSKFTLGNMVDGMEAAVRYCASQT